MPEFDERLNIGMPSEIHRSKSADESRSEKANGNASFLRAARSGNLDKILECLKQGVDVNVCNLNGLSAMHLASKEGHEEIVRELLNLGAHVNAKTKKGNSSLHVAALAGQANIVRILVENQAEVNVQSQNGFTPLYMAAQEGHDGIVQYLIANGGNPNLATDDGYTPLAVALQQGHDRVVSSLLGGDAKGKPQLSALHMAAKTDDTKAALLLLKNYPQPDIISRAGFTPLHIAAHYGNAKIGRLLLEKGANVNFAARHSITPLHVAAKWGRLEMVSLLFAHGAVVDSRTKDSLTPLHCAARSGREAVVLSLLEKGALICAKTKNGLSPLHTAAQGDHVDTAITLLDHRAPVDDVSIDLLTSLHVAAHCGNVRVARLLLDRGADVNAKALNGFTPLHVACKKNRIKMIELLLKYQAAIGVSTQSGLTSLHVAAFAGHTNIVHYLTQHNANVGDTTRQSQTALHFAALGDHPDVVRVLLRNGAVVNAIDQNFHTPLHIACEKGNADIVKTLISHGANTEADSGKRWTPLHMATKSGQIEIVNLLLDARASAGAETTSGITPLHLAAKYGHLSIAKLLIDKGGADMDASGKTRATPLHVATHYNREDIVLYLLEKGAPPRAAAENWSTPLHVAAKQNRLSIAAALLQYGADPNAMSRAGFTPLHLAANEGCTEMVSMLLQHNADPNMGSDNGLTPMHLCAQEDREKVAHILLSYGAKLDSRTQTGYTPLHVACHFARANMVRFLLRYGARVDATSLGGYTPLHQAAQQGAKEIVDILLDSDASPNAVTVDGHTALAIGRCFGHGSELTSLHYVTDTNLLTELAKRTGVVYGQRDPEVMQESYSSLLEDGREDSGLSGDSFEKKQASFDTSTKEFHRIEDGLYQKSKEDNMAMEMDPQLEQLIQLEQQRSGSVGTADSLQQRKMSPTSVADATEAGESAQYQLDGHYLPDNVDIGGGAAHGGKISKKTFLISFLVDARGGAMRGCRHSGVRIIVPPRKAPMPMRITCRYLRKEKLVHPPPLSEGEALASRILEIGPAGAKFLGPVIIEIPHFGSLRNREREVMIIRSDDGEHWKEHQLEATEDAVQEVLNESFDPEELSQLDDLNTTRITRILTNDFPQYFAVVTRIRQEVHAVGPEGGMIGSTVVPRVKAIFPEGALTKTIKVSLQAQPIAQELVTKLHGSHVAVSPIVTVEPRRRKFHKPITLCIPLPHSAHKSVFAQQQHQMTALGQQQQSDGEQKEPPTLRLLCSITGGTAPAKWEDITGTTQLAFSTEHVSFTTTVSARFWLMDCDNPREAARMAQEIYNEAVFVPYMAKFVVFARRIQINEWQLRVFCMTDDKEEKTLERQEHYKEIAKSRDVEVLAARQQYVEFGGNVIPVIKVGEQLNLRFLPFQENRLMFSMKKRDSEPVEAPATGRIAFVREPKHRTDYATHQHPICTLAITLPNTTNYTSLDNSSIDSRGSSLSRKYRFSKPHLSDVIVNTDISVHEVARELGTEAWEPLGRILNIPEDDLRQVRTEYHGQEVVTVLRIWMEREGNRATGENLEAALRQLGRDDIIKARLGANDQKRESINGEATAAAGFASDETESKKPRK